MKVLLPVVAYILFMSNGIAASFSLSDAQKRIFTYQESYHFYESLYEPNVSIEYLEKEYSKYSSVAELPEFIVFTTLKAMIEGDYDAWMKYWDNDSKEIIKMIDEGQGYKGKRITQWEQLFSGEFELSFVNQVQVGEAQFTYYMIICEVKKQEVSKPVVYLYFPFVRDEFGNLLLSEKAKKHPVFDYYIQHETMKYSDGG